MLVGVFPRVRAEDLRNLLDYLPRLCRPEDDVPVKGPQRAGDVAYQPCLATRETLKVAAPPQQQPAESADEEGRNNPQAAFLVYHHL